MKRTKPGLYYREIKDKVAVSLSPTVIESLKEIAPDGNFSGFVEQILRDYLYGGGSGKPKTRHLVDMNTCLDNLRKSENLISQYQKDFLTDKTLEYRQGYEHGKQDFFEGKVSYGDIKIYEERTHFENEEERGYIESILASWKYIKTRL
jgi:hypothetical protein